MRGRSGRWLTSFLVLVASSAALISRAPADEPGWVLYTHPDKLMSVRFPGKPTEADQTGAMPNGDRVAVKVATFIDGDRAFVATAGVYPAGTKMDARTALNGALDSTLARLKGRVVSQKAITIDGIQGREVLFSAPGPYKDPVRGSARVFVSLTPPTSYVVMTMQMDGKPDPAAQKFLRSVHLGRKVETSQ